MLTTITSPGSPPSRPAITRPARSPVPPDHRRLASSVRSPWSARGAERRRPTAAHDPQLLRTPPRHHVVDDLLATALTAPSAGNTQGREFVVLEGTGADRPLLGGHHRRSVAAAAPDGSTGCPGPRWWCSPSPTRGPTTSATASPTRCVPTAPTSSGSSPIWHVDAAFAVMTLLLGAADRGVGCRLPRELPRRGALADALGVPVGTAVARRRAARRARPPRPAVDFGSTSTPHAGRQRPPRPLVTDRRHRKARRVPCTTGTFGVP